MPVVTPENVYNLRMKSMEAKNIKGGDLFYTHPSKMPPQQPQPNPDLIKAEVEKMKGEQKAALQQMKDETKNQQMLMKQDFDAAKTKFLADADLQKQREAQAVEVGKQREQQAAQSAESDKAAQRESEMKLVDMIWDKGKENEKRQAEEQKAKLDAVLGLIEQNSKAQNDMLQKVLEAAMAERENEVSERDSKGKVKKVTSRVKKKAA